MIACVKHVGVKGGDKLLCRSKICFGLEMLAFRRVCIGCSEIGSGSLGKRWFV